MYFSLSASTLAAGFSVAVKDLFDLFGFSVFLYLPFVRFHFLHRPVIMTAGIADKIAADTAATDPRIKRIGK